MSRGGPMGGRGGFHPGMRGGRGILRGIPPRGMGGFNYRGGPPRGGGPPMRGRPPMYSNQGSYQSSQSQVSSQSSSQPPPPADGSPPTAASTASTQSSTKPVASSTISTSQSTVSANGGTSNGPSSGTSTNAFSQSPRGGLRGRGSMGGYNSRGRGGYSSNINVSGSMEMSGPPPQKSYRGGPPRGRGGYQGMSRPPPVIQPGMTQGAPVPSLKRGPPIGLPGPKRGRYDQGPTTRPYAPKYTSYSQQQVPTHPPQHSSYHSQPAAVQRYLHCNDVLKLCYSMSNLM